jgi:hypothetical protein
MLPMGKESKWGTANVTFLFITAGGDRLWKAW